MAGRGRNDGPRAAGHLAAGGLGGGPVTPVLRRHLGAERAVSGAGEDAAAEGPQSASAAGHVPCGSAGPPGSRRRRSRRQRSLTAAGGLEEHVDQAGAVWLWFQLTAIWAIGLRRRSPITRIREI